MYCEMSDEPTINTHNVGVYASLIYRNTNIYNAVKYSLSITWRYSIPIYVYKKKSPFCRNTHEISLATHTHLQACGCGDGAARRPIIYDFAWTNRYNSYVQFEYCTLLLVYDV